jgi:hypothetical protein
VGRTGSGGTYLEDLHLLQHELLHFLVILGQHDDLLYCPAVWNGPGRTSVGLGTLGKGQSLSPFPHQGPNSLRTVEQEFHDEVEGFPSGEGKRPRGPAQDKGQGLPPNPHFGPC